MNTKLHAITDASGRPIRFFMTTGQVSDYTAGNVTMENEALTIDNLSQAMAAKNSGGVVIVQVEHVVARGTVNPRDVVIPVLWSMRSSSRNLATTCRRSARRIYRS